jgi:hypothetical protein
VISFVQIGQLAVGKIDSLAARIRRMKGRRWCCKTVKLKVRMRLQWGFSFEASNFLSNYSNDLLLSSSSFFLPSSSSSSSSFLLVSKLPVLPSVLNSLVRYRPTTSFLVFLLIFFFVSCDFYVSVVCHSKFCTRDESLVGNEIVLGVFRGASVRIVPGLAVEVGKS